MVYSCEYCCLAESAYRREKKRGEPAKESSGYFGFSIGRTFLGLPTNVGSAKTGTASATWPRDRADSWKLMGSLHRWATTSARSRVLTANKTCKRTDHVHESELCILNNDFFFFLFFRYDERNILGTLFGKKVVVEFYFRERLLRGKKKERKMKRYDPVESRLFPLIVVRIIAIILIFYGGENFYELKNTILLFNLCSFNAFCILYI